MRIAEQEIYDPGVALGVGGLGCNELPSARAAGRAKIRLDTV